jgi:hypothetical protein
MQNVIGEFCNYEGRKNVKYSPLELERQYGLFESIVLPNIYQVYPMFFLIKNGFMNPAMKHYSLYYLYKGNYVTSCYKYLNYVTISMILVTGIADIAAVAMRIAVCVM